MASQALNAHHPVGRDPDQRLARSLGWFSIGLGATEILAPGWSRESAAHRTTRGPVP